MCSGFTHRPLSILALGAALAVAAAVSALLVAVSWVYLKINGRV